MAETTDRPNADRGEGAPASPPGPPSSITPGLAPAALPAWEKLSQAPRGTVQGPEDPTYRPLSMLAVAGLSVSALYALTVVVGSVVAYFNRTPWLLPAWTVLIPLTGILLSWMAQGRIRESEGTLEGVKLTQWGIGLSLVFGLMYWAYFTATYFAVRQQALEEADRFLKLLSNGQTEKAFLYTLQPRPAESANLRTQLEIQYNSPPDINKQGKLTSFEQADYVHWLQMGGPEADVKQVGLKSWSYEKGGYQIVSLYRVATPALTFDLVVTLHGIESRLKDSPGRQWQVDTEGTGLAAATMLHFTPQGQSLRTLGQAGKTFADKWLAELTSGQPVQAYLDTLPAAERDRLGKEANIASLAGRALAGGPAVVVQDGPTRQLWDGYKAFEKGSLVRADKDRFWVEERSRDGILGGVKGIFEVGDKNFDKIKLAPNPVPTWQQDGERVRFFYDFLMLLPEHMVEGQLVVETDPGPPGAAGGQPACRVQSLDLVRARTLVQSAPKPRPGRGR